MLQIASVLDDAIRAVSKYGDSLPIAALPATVYLMQMDVINHYQHALDHYLTLPLDSENLQNSSLGTPYQKWAHVTNGNFKLLSFAINNLLRYTNRLFYETEHKVLANSGRLRQIAPTCHTYTGAICDIQDGDEIGIAVDPGERLVIKPLRRLDGPTRIVGRHVPEGPTQWFRVTRDSDENEQMEPIDEAEYERSKSRPEIVDITDRTILVTVQDRGYAELVELRQRMQTFKQACDGFYASRSITEPFEELNLSCWT